MRVAYERLVFVWLILLRHVPEILTHREAFNQDKAKREEYERLMRQKKKTPPANEADEVPTMKNELLVGI